MGTARRLIAITAAALTAALVPAAISADPGPATAAGGGYLALGDSVTFGYVPPQAVPPPNYLDASSFVGYPEDLAQQLGLTDTNASCPGETSASFLTPGAQSNGCENSPGSPFGYRTFFPLHVAYQGTQMSFALSYLAANRGTRLVTLNIGANDYFLCVETTSDGCSSPAELAGVAGTIGSNLASILRQLHGTGYRGPIVVLTYYALSYTDPKQVLPTAFLDAVTAGVARLNGATVADGFTAFALASAPFGGDPCAAGLLIRLPDGTCNVHPSAAGQQVLAAAVAHALGR
jgi:lysophospholipase L1-like esterase